MDIDLIFTAVKQSEWRQISNDGRLEETLGKTDESVRSFEGKHAEAIINHYFEGDEDVFLVVFDPLRIQVPIKRIKEDGFEMIWIKGAVSVDVIIDKVLLKPDKKGRYSVDVKHFD